MTYIIRTSDRMTFKNCRQRWDFSSKIRQNLQPISVPKPLDFGTAIHKGLQVYYNPLSWSLVPQPLIEIRSLGAFSECNKKALADYEEATGQPADEEVLADFKEREELGLGMLKHYFDWAKRLDEDLKPVYVEIEFEVPIPVPPSVVPRLPTGFRRNGDGNLEKFRYITESWELVVYQGRIDLMFIDNLGRYWIVDHKTAGQMRDDVIAFMEMDEQMKSYAWAIQRQLGVPIAGIIYNELYKGLPGPPALNKTVRKGCSYSVNKMQDTSYEVYLATVKEFDAGAYAQGLYDEMLEYLKLNPKQWIRRTQVMYNDTELENLGNQICLEAIDMLNDPFIYPHPTRFQCGYCPFRAPCLATMDGSDVGFLLRMQYRSGDNKANYAVEDRNIPKGFSEHG